MTNLLALVFAVLMSPGKQYPATFKSCYDGDTCTFDIVINDETHDLPFELNERTILTRLNQRIRLCDINAPEMKGPDVAAATKARDDLVRWISGAKDLQLQIAQKTGCTEDSCDKTEKYGRLLGWIIADGVNLNELQVQRGNAVDFIRCPRERETLK